MVYMVFVGEQGNGVEEMVELVKVVDPNVTGVEIEVTGSPQAPTVVGTAPDPEPIAKMSVPQLAACANHIFMLSWS